MESVFERFILCGSLTEGGKILPLQTPDVGRGALSLSEFLFLKLVILKKSSEVLSVCGVF